MVEGERGLMCVFWAGGMYDKRLEMRYFEGDRARDTHILIS